MLNQQFLNVSTCTVIIAMARTSSQVQRSILVVAAAIATLSLVVWTPTIFAEMGNYAGSNFTTSPQNTSSSTMTAMNNTTMLAGGKNAKNIIMELNLGAPVLTEHDKTTNATNIDQNTTQISFEGNATIMLPAGNLSTTDTGNATIVSMNGFVRVSGEVMYKTLNGQENAIVTFTEYRPNNANVGIGTAYIQTNSNAGQQLAPLNNTIGVFKDQFVSQTESIVTFWKWQENKLAGMDSVS